VQIKDAGHLWGKTTWETEEAIKKDDKMTSVCSIGAAGENLVRTACVIVDWYNAQGMCGPGAVFGSKNLKAVGARGTKGVRICSADEFERLAKEGIEQKLANPDCDMPNYGLEGTPLLTDMQKRDDWPFVKYATTAIVDKYDNYLSNHILNYTVRPKSCFACPVHCKRFYEVKDGRYRGLRGGGIEYNAVKYNAVVCGLDNWGEICYLNNLYNQLGITVNHGTTIAYMIYLYKKGLLTKKQTDGIELDWGDAELVADLIHKTAYREGFLGNLLAEGGLNAGRILGPDALSHYLHVLGLESWPDFRGKLSIWIHRCTSTRGCDHLRGDCGGGSVFYWAEILSDKRIADPNTTYGKALAAMNSQNVSALMDSYTVCKFLYVIWGEKAARILSALTGEDFSSKMLWTIGERIYNLEQAFNFREGVKRKHMVPPPRWLNEPQPDGRSKGLVCTMKIHDGMMDEYLKLRGWDIKTGAPSQGKLDELGLGNVARELKAGAPYPDWKGPPIKVPAQDPSKY
jgi:aldehyde:ferredoxin oxidoreductase